MSCCGSVMFDKLWSMHLISRFPHVVAFRVSFPFDEVLKVF